MAQRKERSRRLNSVLKDGEKASQGKGMVLVTAQDRESWSTKLIWVGQREVWGS